MNKCIYLKETEPNLTFNSEEHIIPAGIGGLKKLDKGFVSDQANTEIFSKLELEFMRDSIIALPRQFYGPGKRGSLSIKKATKSNIQIMNPNDDDLDLRLGYLTLGKPFFISQIKISSNKDFSFIFSKDIGNFKEEIKKIIDAIYSCSSEYNEFTDKRMSTEEFIIGIEREKLYLLKNPNTNIPILSKIGDILESFNYENVKLEYNENQITSNFKSSFNIENYYRIYAKTAFNFLALSQGQEYVLKEEFDEIRNWIVNGGENKFVITPEVNKIPFFLSAMEFPDLSHKIFISSCGNYLLGLVSFYSKEFSAIVTLSKNIKESIQDGFICDWKNKKEYSFLDFLIEKNNSKQKDYDKKKEP